MRAFSMNSNRQPNWTESGRYNLIEIIKKYFPVVECKKTDTINKKSKERAWFVIAHEFSGQNDTLRSGDDCRTCWTTLKKSANKYNGEKQRQMYLTGGGRINIGSNPLLDSVLAMVQKQADGLENKFDSDAARAPIQHHTSMEHDEYENSTEVDQSNRDSHTWGTYQPKQLKTAMSKPLQNTVNHVKRQFNMFGGNPSKQNTAIFGEKKLKISNSGHINRQRPHPYKFEEGTSSSYYNDDLVQFQDYHFERNDGLRGNLCNENNSNIVNLCENSRSPKNNSPLHSIQMNENVTRKEKETLVESTRDNYNKELSFDLQKKKTELEIELLGTKIRRERLRISLMEKGNCDPIIDMFVQPIEPQAYHVVSNETKSFEEGETNNDK